MKTSDNNLTYSNLENWWMFLFSVIIQIIKETKYLIPARKHSINYKNCVKFCFFYSQVTVQAQKQW